MRIILGTGSVFLYRNEERKAEADIQDEPQITYLLAMEEKRKNDDIAAAESKAAEKAKIEAETAQKMAALQAKMDAEQALRQAEIDAQQAEMAAKMKLLQDEVNAKHSDAEAQQAAQEAAARAEAEMKFKLE